MMLWYERSIEIYVQDENMRKKKDNIVSNITEKKNSTYWK